MRMSRIYVKRTTLKRAVLFDLSKTISRILYQTIIYLGCALPSQLVAELRESGGQPLVIPSLASDGVCMCQPALAGRGGLLPRLSTLTCPKTGGLFLLHFP